jgi:cysteine desulfurase / selenocysteine lyase
MSLEQRITTDSPYDVAALRRDFPILARNVHDRPLVYLDNAASAQKPNQVLDAMRAFATSEYANVHRGVHYLSGAATERYDVS